MLSECFLKHQWVNLVCNVHNQHFVGLFKPVGPNCHLEHLNIEHCLHLAVKEIQFHYLG